MILISYFSQELQDSLKTLLTASPASARIPIKLNRLDRGARFISTVRQGQAAAGDRKGSIAEVFWDCLSPECWVVGKYPPNCHRHICEALSVAVEAAISAFPDFHGLLVTRRSNFFRVRRYRPQTKSYRSPDKIDWKGER